MRKIAVVEKFFESRHKEQIEAAASRSGFTVDYYPEGAIPPEKAGGYEVVYGMPTVSALKGMTALRWFCASFAGVDRYVSDEIYPNPHVLLTNSAGAYGVTIAEHIMMVTLMLLRQMPVFIASDARREWHAAVPVRALCGSTITVLGTGDIGTQFARRAKAMGAAHINGVRRSQQAADPAFDSVCTFAAMGDVLPATDILVMALPATAETYHILNAATLAQLPATAIVVNVGRGTAVDQDALMAALNADRLAGAALDVFDPEPLPPDHPLWSTKNLLITPHIAGNMSLAITRDKDVTMFCEDLARYTAGQPLLHAVDRKRGY